MNRKSIKSITTQILIILGIIVVINILAEQFYFRLDFTADKRYTLSQASKDILKALERISERLPFDVLGIDSDNGSEFINHHLWRYCRDKLR